MPPAEYSAGGIAYWTDAQLQARLDDRRFLVQDAPIIWHPRRATGGTYTYTLAAADAVGWLEAGSASGTAPNPGTIVDGLGSAVGGWTISRDGWITFSSDRQGHIFFLNAWSYDLYAAAADVLEQWASAAKLTPSHFKTEDQEFDLGSQIERLGEVAKSYRERELAISVPAERSDTLGC